MPADPTQGTSQPTLRYLDHREERWKTFTPRADLSLTLAANERPLGAVYLGEAGAAPRTSFLVWAPSFAELGVQVEAKTPSGQRLELRLHRDPNESGYFLGEGAVPPGSCYRYLSGDGSTIGADPAALAYDKSRMCSVVLDRRFVWRVRERLRRASANLPQPEQLQLIAQVHLGTSGGVAGLPELFEYYRQLGFDGVQTLPETLFPGRFNAGYDVSSLFTVEPCYGSPAELAEVNALAAELGLARLADRVHNHVHPINLLEPFGPYFQADANEWGRGPTCAGPEARAVRRYHREADVRWLDDLGFTGLRYDATFRLDDRLNRLLAADAELGSLAVDRPLFTIAEDNHNDRRVTRGRELDARAFGFSCQYAPDKRHSALALALLAARDPITKHYLKPFIGLRQDQDASQLYADSTRWRQACERAFDIHVKALRQGMGIAQHKGQHAVPLEPPGEQPPWATLALVEYHDGPQNNEAGQFIAAEMGPARTATHYLAHAVGPETKLVFRGAEEAACSSERRFGWLADLDAVDKLNAAMGRHLGDLAGDRTIKPPWHPDFVDHGGSGPRYLVDPDCADVPLTWGNWRVSWVIERAREVAERTATAELLRPDLLQPESRVPQVLWQRYFGQIAQSGLALVDFASPSALDAYRFDSRCVSAAAKVAREHFSRICATLKGHVPQRDWRTMCVLAWPSSLTALLQRWDAPSGRRLLFWENLSTKPVALTLTPDAALLDGRRGRLEPLGGCSEDPERDYRARWERCSCSADAEWRGHTGPAGREHGSLPARIDLSVTEPGEAHLQLAPGHAVLYLGQPVSSPI